MILDAAATAFMNTIKTLTYLYRREDCMPSQESFPVFMKEFRSALNVRGSCAFLKLQPADARTGIPFLEQQMVAGWLELIFYP